MGHVSSVPHDEEVPMGMHEKFGDGTALVEQLVALVRTDGLADLLGQGQRATDDVLLHLSSGHERHSQGRAAAHFNG